MFGDCCACWVVLFISVVILGYCYHEARLDTLRDNTVMCKITGYIGS
jgi:hypothetical protein